MRRVLTVAVASFLFATSAHAQSRTWDWASHVVITAAGVTATELIADKPSLGAAFGLAFAAGYHYMTLRVNDWEVGKTGRGAAMIGPIVTAVALTLIFEHSGDDGLGMGSRQGWPSLDDGWPSAAPGRSVTSLARIPDFGLVPNGEARLEALLVPPLPILPVGVQREFGARPDAPVELQRRAVAAPLPPGGVEVLVPAIAPEGVEREAQSGLVQVGAGKDQRL